MALNKQSLTERYTQILEDYLHNSNEVALTQGYELARCALKDGHGVIEISAIHHQCLRRLVVEREMSDEVLEKAGDFFAECLSPFEMSHRGAQEGTRALRYLNEILEAELKRIAHALHDEAAQLLASVHIALADVACDVPQQAKERFDKIERLLRQIEEELRGLSHELRPTVLDNLGLLPALEFLAEKVVKRTGITVLVQCESERRLPSGIETALYRIVQEALNNAIKHAHANNVKIQLECRPLKVLCRISDDGVGFVVQNKPDSHSLGLLGIRERLNALGGSLSIITEPGNGTTILTDIPLGG
jgi:signal transduction histidine kinase